MPQIRSEESKSLRRAIQLPNIITQKGPHTRKMTNAASQGISPNTHHTAEYRWRRSELPEILLRVPKRIKVKQEPIVDSNKDSNNEIIVIEDD